ncbi:(S)-2-hydroxy-acid oxidase subunit GlcE [Granulibacter bethesdensis]|nr:(S)-2-hydroxy-acid oxidase subunit GlcE [Granulibacter bethesdensis]APH51954.1 (S)-2-hydroxy-acid oxidase subunit GlcE [Granulibacter bethesdensis]
MVAESGQGVSFAACHEAGCQGCGSSMSGFHTQDAPDSEQGVVDTVQAAVARRETLCIEGNATKAAMLRPVRADRVLSTRHLAGITLYSPNEMIISARPGTPIDVLEAALAEHRQILIAEPPDLRHMLCSGEAQTLPQTLGGLVATNLAGPRRIQYGSFRDHVLGVRAVNGRGELIHSGGRVLKNVTGLDFSKLLTGSFGTLAVLTEITLKVLPADETVGTLILPCSSPEQGVRLLSAGLGSPFGVTGAAWVAHLDAACGPAALLRIEAFAPSAHYRLEKLQAMLGGHLLGHKESVTLWRDVRDVRFLTHAPTDAIWRVSVAPSVGPAIVSTAQQSGGAVQMDWGGGLVWVSAPANTETHHALTRAVASVKGSWTLMRAPDAMRQAVDVIPPESAALARLGAGVREAFDPHALFNPGRMRVVS